MKTRQFEADRETFPADAYRVLGFSGVACRVRGWHVEPDEDTEWSGEMTRTGRVVVTMIGDDVRHLVDPSDVFPIADVDYCAECGQLGCTHDGRDRETTEDS